MTMVLLPMLASADNSGTCGTSVTWSWVESTKTLTISGTGAMNDYDNSKWTDDVPLFSENPWDQYNDKIEKVVIGSGVTYIGGGSFYGANGTKYVNLKTVIIGSGVTEIGYFAFRHCEGLTSITVESGNSYFDSRNSCNAVIEKSSNKLIVGCKATVIPSSVKEIGSAAFNCLQGITSVTIPDGVVTIGQVAFYGCTNLTTVSIGNDVTEVGDASFYCCDKITTLILGNKVSKIGRNAFTGCTGLTSISFPNSLTSIGDYAFWGCENLNSITFPDNVSSIGSSAFRDCSNITSVTLGYYLSNIGSYAFLGCNKLGNVYCSAPVPPSAEYPFDNDILNTMYLHVPSSSLSLYQENLGYEGGGWCSIPLSHISVLTNPGSGKLAIPTITLDNGVLKFDCGTNDAEYHYSISYPESNSNTIGNNVQMPLSFTVSVYAIKAGFEKSDTATKQFTIANGIRGDLNGDGEVNVADHVELSDIIFGK